MFGMSDYRLQVFSQDGQLTSGVIRNSDIMSSSFFSLDQIGNIIVADCWEDRIKIFSNSGQLIHSISNDTPTKGKKLSRPTAISTHKQNNIVVAHMNMECSLIAFKTHKLFPYFILFLLFINKLLLCTNFNFNNKAIAGG